MLSSGFDECTNTFPARISRRLCVRFREYQEKAEKAIERALRKEEKSFYKFHSLPFAFLLCPTTLNSQRLRLCPEIVPFSKSVSTRANPAYSLDPVSFRFSLSRPISAEDIRSAIRAQNLNKTNQYSNPPLSLADSPSVPFSAFLLTSFYFLLYLFLFISISRTFNFDHFHLLGLFLVCSDPLFIDTISEASHLFASLCRIRRSLFFLDLFSIFILIGFQ